MHQKLCCSVCVLDLRAEKLKYYSSTFSKHRLTSEHGPLRLHLLFSRMNIQRLIANHSLRQLHQQAVDKLEGCGHLNMTPYYKHMQMNFQIVMPQCCRVMH